MKKIKNLLLMVLVGGFFSLTACTDDIEREPSPIPVDGVQAYVYADKTDLTFLSTDAQQFVVKVARQIADEAATVHLNVSGAEGFNAPSIVEFAAGEKSKDVTVSFDIPLGSSAQVSLSIPEEEAYLYAGSSVTFNIVRDYTWLNMGVWTLYTQFFGGKGQTQVFLAKEKTLYKLVEPYEVGYNLLIEVDGENAIVKKQAIAPKISKYNTLYIEGKGTFKDNVFDLTCLFSVAEGNFGAHREIIALEK